MLKWPYPLGLFCMAKGFADSAKAKQPTPGRGSVRNLAGPRVFKNIKSPVGFMTETVRNNEDGLAVARCFLLSDDSFFYSLAENIAGLISDMAKEAIEVIDVHKYNHVLLVYRQDATAHLWLDTAAVTLGFVSKRSLAAGSLVHDTDIADITEMSFPAVDLGRNDKIVYVFRVGWRFGLAFDLTGNLDVSGFARDLATLYRKLRYYRIYLAISEGQAMEELLKTGWFPFIEIAGKEFEDLLITRESGLSVDEWGQRLIERFDGIRMQRILERWLARPHFASKEQILRAAISAYCRHEPVSVIKILLTEIEGVLQNAYKARNSGKAAENLKSLLEFAQVSGEDRAGGSSTLFFTSTFAKYLRVYTFSHFNPASELASAGSRHAVGHGAATQKSYTMQRALQAVLTMDQLSFYT
jgi:hypothetical protein